MKLCIAFILAIISNLAFAVNVEVSFGGDGYYTSKQNYRWVPFRGGIPAYAVAGGVESGRILYVCQAFNKGSMHPGKIVDGRCNITYAGQEIQKTNFNILVGRNVHWESVYGGRIPRNAVVGGSEPGRVLYICQANFGGGVHPGKVVSGNCNIGYGGNEVTNTKYRVLVSGSGSRPRPNPYRPGYYTSQVPAEDGSQDSGYSTSQDSQDNQPGYHTSQEGVGVSPSSQGGYH